MTARKRIQVEAAIIFNRQNQVLLSTRPKGKSYAGYWEFVGGKLEESETEYDCLIREIKEELNLKISHATQWLKKNVYYKKVHLNLNFWRIQCADWSGEIIAKENQQWEWVAIKDITLKKLLPANYSFVNALLIPSELYIQNKEIQSNDQAFSLIHYQQATQKKQFVYISYLELEQNRMLPNYLWVAIEVNSKIQLEASLGANAVIWNIDSTDSFDDLVTVLKLGQFIPILAMNFSKIQQQQLLDLGIHGLIFSKP